MPTPDPKSSQQAGAQKSAYPLDRYTVAPKQDDGGEKSPYYQPSAPSVSLPKGGGALKGIDEKFSVNAINGTAGVQVGMPFSPGRGGFTPSLSLSYSSGSGNSEFGLGWGLGLPSIQRRTDKKLPMYDDAEESDVFIMAGAEDLQPSLLFSGGTWINDIVTSGVYTAKRYRPRIEGLYALIEHISATGDSHTWWKVTTKDNVVTYYGLSTAGRISDPSNSSRIYKWLPELTFDNKGNVQQYFYVTDNNGNVPIPHALHEQNRSSGLAQFTNTYLNNVAYCNVTPFTPSNNYFPSVATSYNGPGAPNYMMLMVMDYGNYNLLAPTPGDTLPVPVRTDPFSDFHAGFEIRTYRRCMRALMFHFFTELNSGSPVLIRSLDFAWQSDADSPMPEYTEADYIISITQSGYLLQSGTYFKKSLPPLTMTYNSLQWSNTLNAVSPEDMENAPQGLTGPYQWIDLWGEGIPGILTEQADSWFYKRNLGNGHFAPSLAVAEKPSFQGLGTTMQWSDLDADGRRQLVARDGVVRGYFELDDDQEWLPFRAFKENINVDWNSPYTKLLDLNGDGRPDLLITEERAWQWYENAGTDGFKEGGYGPVSYNEEQRPRLLLNDMVQTIFLADMNGDGMTDIVRIQNGEVCYWPNVGYGKFGAKVTMTDAPWFDRQDIFNPEYVILADISGTGAADLIYIGKEKCTAWINLAGNAWSFATDIAPIPGAEMYSKVTVADMLGIGTPCIIWSSPLPQYARAPMRYINLMGGNKPYLMTSYDNSMGKTISLTYKQSTQYYLEDMAAGTPWATNLPFPVHCVSEVTTTDDVSQTIYTQQYSYHHGYYDHPEREFRGFGRVDTIDTDTAIAYNGALENDLDQYPVLTKTWYHTGAWMRESTLINAFAAEYCQLGSPPDPELSAAPVLLPVSTSPPTSLTAQDEREAYRAMKGQFLRQEVYALDDSGLDTVPYTVATQSFCIQQVQPVATNLYGSFFCYKQQALNYSCERNTADPRVLHELTLSVDQYGNVLESAKVSYPRQAAPPSPLPAPVTTAQALMLCTYSVNAYTNDAIVTGSAYRLRLPCDTAVYELTGLLTVAPSGLWTPSGLYNSFHSAAAINFTDIANNTSLQSRLLTRVRMLFATDAAPATPLALYQLQPLAISYQQYHLAIANNILSSAAYYNSQVTDAMLTEGGYQREDNIHQFPAPVATNYWLPGGTVTYDTAHFYTPTAYTDPFGNPTILTYWSTGATNYYLLPQSVTDPLSNVTTVTAYNWYNLQPAAVLDPNNNVSQMLYDALGMPVAMALCSKNNGTQGDILTGIKPQDPSDIANQATFFTNPESVATALLQGATWRCVYDLTASPVAVGMIGREFHYYGTHPTPPSPPDNSILLRLTYTDGLGRIAMNKVQAAPADGATTLRWIGSGKTVYNNKGNVVMQYEPYFSATPLYDAAEQAAMAGVTPRIHYDPLNRVIRTDLPDGSYTMTTWTAWMQSIYDNNDTVLTSAWYAAAIHGTTQQQDAATKAAYCNNTPTVMHLDTLARPFFTIQNNVIPPSVTIVPYNSYVDLDIQGNRLAIHDARGLTPITYSYDMLQSVAQQKSVDSGTQYTLADVANNPLYMWDAAGRRFHFTYDALRRRLTKQALISGTTYTLEQLVYGETATTPQTYNLCGKVYKSYDGAGYKIIPGYDFKGNPLQTQEQLLATTTTTDVNWPSAGLSTEVFSSSYTYDALNRVIQFTDPGGNITANTYDAGGMLYAVAMTPSAASTPTSYITEITYDAKYQRQVIIYGNGTKTLYYYDPNTFRVIRILTTKAATAFQDLNYWYDPVGNVTMLNDASQRTIFFAGAVALPTWSYTYDALYRLVIATGRELIGPANFGTNDNYSDTPWISPTYYPNDSTACQNYTEYYTYDAVGNIVSLQHAAGASSSYTRNYNYDAASNKLLKTAVGSNTYSYGYDAMGNMSAFPHLSQVLYNSNNYMSMANLGGGGNAYYQYDSSGQVINMTLLGCSLKRVYDT